MMMRTIKWLGLGFLLLALSGCGDTGADGGSVGAGGSASGGQRGSSARMAQVDNYLYAISGDTIQLFDIEQGDNPMPWVQVQVDWAIETIYPYGDYLLIGAANGVYVLDNTDRASPTLIGEFVHATAEDPVVASANLAYVTLRRADNQSSAENSNRLDVVDISDPANPVLVNTVEMNRPAGLAVDGDRLHICDGDAGLKTFSLENPRAPTLMFSLVNARCTDMIVTNDLLIATGVDGIQQYDLSMDRPALISSLQRETTIVVVQP